MGIKLIRRSSVVLLVFCNTTAMQLLYACALFLSIAAAAPPSHIPLPPLKYPNPKQSTFEFDLVVSRRFVLTKDDPDTGDPVFYEWNKGNSTHSGVFQVKECEDNWSDELDIAELPIGDGRYREFLAVNGQLPGPPLVVYENSEVVVHVHNQLPAEGISMHFHGVLQRNTFWADGTAFISQCPIMPGQSFTHRFRAGDAGTYFYHSHVSTHRIDGQFGAFVVLKREENDEDLNDYAIVLADWFEAPGPETLLKAMSGFHDAMACYEETKTYDGSKVGELPWFTALINGIGWANMSEVAKEPERLPVPSIAASKTTLLRFINAGAMHPFMISAEGFKFALRDFSHATHFDELYISPGERWDIDLIPHNTKNECSAGFCKLYVRSVEKFGNGNVPIVEERYALGYVLTETETEDERDEVPVLFNAPFQSPPESEVHVTFDHFDLKNSKNYSDDDPLMHPKEGAVVKQFMLNVFRDTNINGLSYIYPKAPTVQYPHAAKNLTVSCDECGADEDECSCTHTLEVPLGAVVQMILYNRGISSLDMFDLDGFAHPIHLHGYKFTIVKRAFPAYNETTGWIESFNEDIECGESETCDNAKWRNEKWNDLNGIDGLNLLNPISLDTVQVPMGGYVVVRFLADNPGEWMLHCHFMPHHIDGMALRLKVGTDQQLPPQPLNMPECYFGEEQAPEKEKGKETDKWPKWGVGVTVAALVVLVAEAFFMIYRAVRAQKRRTVYG